MAYWMTHDFSTSLFLFEASGDSEAVIVSGSDPNAQSQDLDDHDDAESCSWDNSFIAGADENLDDIEWVGDAGTDCNESVEGGGPGGDYRDWVFDQMSGGSNGLDSPSSSVCLIEGVVDQDLKKRNDRAVLIDRMHNGEEEDDDQKRLFWETCLEVGYP
ncbi:hypothetical protein Syun_007782 [Stephania yunnanensis]|uniref:Uncharacterized protein n=1 Tax=Stephania yunnanensis TaxID=152371 RepID=A0AAP0Q2Q5_9MAGN